MLGRMKKKKKVDRSVPSSNRIYTPLRTLDVTHAHSSTFLCFLGWL